MKVGRGVLTRCHCSLFSCHVAVGDVAPGFCIKKAVVIVGMGIVGSEGVSVWVVGGW